MKYVGKYNYTNSAIDTTNIQLSETGEPILDDRNQLVRTEVESDVSANLFSIGLQYEISAEDIILAHKPSFISDRYAKDKKFISLAGLKFSTTFEYSNTGTDNNLDSLSFDVKTEKGFKYNLGVSYTGCISDLLKGRIGCHDDNLEINEVKKKFYLSEICQAKKTAHLARTGNERDMDYLLARIQYLEKNWTLQRMT